MPTVSFQAPTDYSAEAEQIARSRKYAELMQAQSMQPMGDTQMAGGWAIRNSPFQGLAKVLQAYGGRKGQEDADEKQKALADRVRQQGMNDVSAFTGALQGKPAQAEIPANEMDYMGTAATPAQAGDKQKALAIALQSQNPMVAGAGQAILADMLKPKDVKAYKPGDVLYQDGKQVGAIPAKPEWHVVGGNLVQAPAAPAAPGAPASPVTPVFTAPKTDKDESEKLRDILTAAGIDPKSPQGQSLFKSLATKIATHQPSASNNVTIKQEGAEAGAVGKNFGEEFSNLQKGGVAANTKLANLDRMESLLTGVKTGKLTPMGTEVAALADSLGIKIDKNLGNKQAAEALSNGIALELRNPSGGAGMPGAMSDKDREFLMSMTPGLSKTPEGNKLIIETARKLAKRDQQVAKLARDYRQKNGHMDEGFYNQLQEFSDKNPLFTAPTADIHSQADAILKGKK